MTPLALICMIKVYGRTKTHEGLAITARLKNKVTNVLFDALTIRLLAR